MKTIKCIKCESKRVLNFSGKTSDSFGMQYKDKDYDGYVPTDVGLGSDEDYIEMEICLECGQIQDKFPIPEEKIELYFD